MNAFNYVLTFIAQRAKAEMYLRVLENLDDAFGTAWDLYQVGWGTISAMMVLLLMVLYTS